MNSREKNKEELATEAGRLQELVIELKTELAAKESALSSLQSREARYRQAVEASPNPILSMDKEGRILSWNNSCEEVTGYSSIIGQEFAALILEPEQRAFMLEVVLEVFSGRSFADLRLDFRRKDGTVAKMSSRAYPILDRNNNVIECVLASTDLTFLRETEELLLRARSDLEQRVSERTIELVSANVVCKREIAVRKRIEDRLRESEARFRDIAFSMADWIWEVDTNWVITYCSDQVNAILGYSNNEVVGTTLFDTVVQEDKESTKAEFVGFAGKDQAVRDMESWHVSKDGARVCLLTNGVSIVDVQGSVKGYRGVSKDITERKRAEQALQESEERYRAIFEHAEDIIYIKSLDSRYLHVNPAMERIIGIPASEIIGCTDRDLFGEVEGSRTRAIDLRVINGEIFREEQTKVLKGATSAFHIVKTPLREPSGKIVGIMGIARDVTDRKKAEEALREHEQMLQNTLTVSPVAISYVEGGRLIWTNQAMAQIFGYEREEEYLGQKARDFYASDDEYKRVLGIFSACLKKGDPVETEALFRRKDGSPFDGLLKITVLDPSRPGKGTISSITDISERKKADEALRESRAKYMSLYEDSQRIAELYRTLLDASPDPIVVYDIEGIPTYINPAFTRCFGWTFQEVEGRRIDFVPPESWPETSKMIDMVLNGQSFYNVETKRYTKDGRIIDASISGAVYFDKNGKAVGSVIQLRDITEYKRLEEQLRQAAKMEAVGKLAGGVAHDFNNLLTAMMGYSNMLMQQLPMDSPHREKLLQIIRATERAADVTRQLLAFGRKQVLEVKAMDLNELVSDLDNMLQRLIGEHIELITSLDTCLGTIRADPGKIEQVIMNLVVNARDAMPNGGTLTIETANVNIDELAARMHEDILPGTYVMLSVSDTGMGMNVETLSRIFDPFFTTKEKGVGTGLGLSTVYGVVKQHSGQISVYSEPGLGTTFKIYLPRVTEQSEVTYKSQIIRHQPRGHETVLVVEDEEIVRDLACEVLEMLGYVTLRAKDPLAALDVCQTHSGRIHLLLTDVVLPKMDGKSLFHCISPTRPEMKVLYMSGYTDDAIVHHGVLERGVHFLQKPFSVEILATKVREVLDTSN